MLNKVIFFFLCGMIIMMGTLISCGESTGRNSQISEKDSLVVPHLSVADAEDQMFYKTSDYLPSISIRLDTSQNKGECFLSTKEYLGEHGLINALVNWLCQKTKTADHQTNIYWNDTPIDTLFLDDFEENENKIWESKKEIVQVIDYDLMWCSAISDALSNEPRDQQIVQSCRTSIQNAETLANNINCSLEPYRNEKKTPHVPLIYVYSFQEVITVYMEHLQRNAFYTFTGYSFYDAQHQKLLHVVEEFDF